MPTPHLCADLCPKGTPYTSPEQRSGYATAPTIHAPQEPCPVVLSPDSQAPPVREFTRVHSCHSWSHAPPQRPVLFPCRGIGFIPGSRRGSLFRCGITRWKEAIDGHRSVGRYLWRQIRLNDFTSTIAPPDRRADCGRLRPADSSRACRSWWSYPEKSRRSDAPPHTRRPPPRVPPFLSIPRREFRLASHLKL